jgi:hypothetical protein
VVLFRADAGDEGQESGEEEEAHLGRSGSLITDFTSMIAVYCIVESYKVG